MVQNQVTTPSPNSVGNALRGVPGPVERHGGRSLQANRRIVTLMVDELNHADLTFQNQFLPPSIRHPIFLILAGLLCGGVPQALAAEAYCWPRFHGSKGDNISTETALLKHWPQQGPRLLWTAKGIGQGFAGVTIADGTVFTAGDIGNDPIISCSGHGRPGAVAGQEWRLLERIGPVRRTGTPTVDGKRLYHENAHDEVVCLDAKTGRKIWGVDLAAQFQGRRDGYGRAESIIDRRRPRDLLSRRGDCHGGARQEDGPDGLEITQRW